MKLTKGPLVQTTKFLLIQKLAHLQKAFVNEGAEGPNVRTILDGIGLFFAENKVVYMSPRVMKFLLSISDTLIEWGSIVICKYDYVPE
jgi:hypothetical protein